jgi:hypothetical protein
MSFGYQVLGFGVVTPAAAASADFTVTISSNVNNYNLATDLSNNGGSYGAGNWNGSDAITVILNIDAGVTVYSANTSTPALVVDLATSDSVLTINNSGSVVGKGGAAVGGSTGNGAAGNAGGHAMSMQDVTVTINNASGAKIQGGGGSGGAGGGSTQHGSAIDEEGVCQDGINRTGGTGGKGAAESSATSSAEVGSNPATGGPGGNGGDFGAAGGNGTGSSGSGCKVTNGSGGAGGAAGKAIRAVSGVSQTLNNSGTVAGATS